MDDAKKLPESRPPSADERHRTETFWQSETAPPSAGKALPERYEDLGVIASGGMGEVRRVRDRHLGRVVAMKLMKPELAAQPAARQRFLIEARCTSGLQHPGIVPVFDQGVTADGSLWFTMKAVEGPDLADAIAELHASVAGGQWQQAPSGWTFRRLVDAFARMCQTLAYAHSQGVIHRDIKPANLMVARFGEVLVMDWGLARLPDETEGDSSWGRDESDTQEPQLTQAGQTLGTLPFMPPEQARAELDMLGPQADVFALGATLYSLLVGRPPYLARSREEMLRQVQAGSYVPISEALRPGHPELAPELRAVCERAMALDPGERYPEAGAMASEILAWLDGEARRRAALEIIGTAREIQPELEATRVRARALRQEAAEILQAAMPFDPLDKKRPGWQLEDEAEELENAVAVQETEWVQRVQSALNLVPELPEAHDLLADHYHALLTDGHADLTESSRTRLRTLIAAHDRGRYTAFLKGDASLSLATDPPGAAVTLHPQVVAERRLVRGDPRPLGSTPLQETSLERGSYLLELTADGCAPTIYPVLIDGGRSWDSVPPGADAALSVPLPPRDELGVDEVYVPAGPFTSGDPGALDGLPQQRVWVDGVIVRRYPVTNGEYLVFLDDLVARGREEEALRHAPRSRQADARGELAGFERLPSGRFTLAQGEEGHRLEADWPVVRVDWHGAVAYADWLTERTGKHWRLLNELEWEKAARGVDGRRFPWGGQPESTWACVLNCTPEAPRPVSVTDYPLDASPFGVRGMAGNARDWCINIWRHEGPPTNAGRLLIDCSAPEDEDYRALRGGTAFAAIAQSQVASRFGELPHARHEGLGFRLCRSWPVIQESL